MAEEKFTPGPWSYTPAVPGATRSFYISGNRDANNREVDIGTVQGGFYSCEANARLIAAAPALYEALKDADSTYDAVLSVTNDDPRFNALRMIVTESQRIARAALSAVSPESAPK